MKTIIVYAYCFTFSACLLRAQSSDSTGEISVQGLRQSWVDTYSSSARDERQAEMKRHEMQRIQDESMARKVALRQKAASLQQAESDQREAQAAMKKIQALDPKASDYETQLAEVLSQHPGALLDFAVRTVIKSGRFLFNAERKREAGGSFSPEKAAQVAAEEASFDAVTADVLRMREASRASAVGDEQTRSLQEITRLNEQQLEELKKQKEELQRIRTQQSDDEWNSRNGRR